MVVAGLVAISFVISGIARTGFGIFSRDISGGTRALNLIFGLVVLTAGVAILKILQTSTQIITTLIVFFIGIGWIIEGALTLATTSRAESKGLAWFAGIVGILADIALIAMPLPPAAVLVIFTGVVFLILGIISVVRAFTFGKDSTVIDA